MNRRTFVSMVAAGEASTLFQGNAAAQRAQGPKRCPCARAVRRLDQLGAELGGRPKAAAIAVRVVVELSHMQGV